MLDNQQFGETIKEYRHLAKLTQEELAKKLHVSNKAVSKWERGLCFPDISLLIPLTDILSISIRELLGEKEKLVGYEEGKISEELLLQTIEEGGKQLKRERKIKTRSILIVVGAAILIFLATLWIFFFYQTNKVYGWRIDGKIIDISSESIIMQGLVTNEEYCRGTYEIDLEEDIEIFDCNGNRTDKNTLTVGDTVRVEYIGRKLQTKDSKLPAKVNNIKIITPIK